MSDILGFTALLIFLIKVGDEDHAEYWFCGWRNSYLLGVMEEMVEFGHCLGGRDKGVSGGVSKMISRLSQSDGKWVGSVTDPSPL